MPNIECLCILGKLEALNVQLPTQIPKPYITSLKDLFDLEDGVKPTLVENNMANKPMGPKSI